MIARISGKIVEKNPTSVIVDCSGVGYFLSISTRTSESIPSIDSNVVLQTEMIVKEDSMQLFGFDSNNEMNMFKLLISISGVGPKTAIGILSGIDPIDLRNVILDENLTALSKLPGIGKKTAERLCFELKNKVMGIIGDSEDSVPNLVEQESIAAMLALGYNNQMAKKSVASAIKDLNTTDLKAEEVIKLALRHALK